MVKKILALLIVLILTLTMGFAEAATTDMFSLIKEIEGTKVFEKEQVIYGKATSGAVITLKTYSEKVVSQKSVIEINSEKVKHTNEWELQDTKEYNIGATEVFAGTLNLKKGYNKIALKIEYASGTIVTKEYKLELIDKEDVMTKLTKKPELNIRKQFVISKL